MKKLTVGATFLLPAITLLGQAAAPGGAVLGVGNFIHVVANLDKSIEFYRDSIGLELTGAPGPHNFSANAVVSSLYDAPGAQSRVASLKIAGSDMAVEMVEFMGVNGAPVRPRLQDPGAIVLSLTVKDLDAVMVRLKKAGAEIVTTGGEAVALSGKAREVMVRDPDGIFIRLTQRDPDAAVSAPAGFGVTVADLDKTMRFYSEVLGFQPQSTADADEKALRVAGVTGARLRRGVALIPGPAFPMEFLEFKGIDQRASHPAIHDPGAGVLRLRVRDLDGLLKEFEARGVPVVSSGGEVVNLGRSRAAIAREMNNLFLQGLQAAQ